MKRMRRVTVMRKVAVGMAMGLACGSGRADLDPPGPPGLHMEAWVTDCRLTAGIDSEWGDESWRLKLTFSQGAHGTTEFTAEGISHYSDTVLPFKDGRSAGDFEVKSRSDITAGPYDAVSLRYSHTECSPATQLLVNVQLEETDLDTGGKVAIGFVSTVVGLLSGGLGTLAEAGIGTGLSGLGIGIDLASSDDSYGAATGAIPPNGQVTLNLTGGSSGSASITLQGKTDELPNLPGCLPPATNNQQVGVLTRPLFTNAVNWLSEMYGRVESGFLKTPEIQPQPGNPGGLTVPRLQAVRENYELALVGVTRMSAVSLMQGALTKTGIAEAFEEYERAEQAFGRKAYPEAYFYFRNAGLAALRAALAGERTEIGAVRRRIVLESPVVNATRQSRMRLSGQILGLMPGETLLSIRTEVSSPKMRVGINPSGKHLAVILGQNLGSFAAGEVLGLDRLSGVELRAADTEPGGMELRVKSGELLLIDGQPTTAETSPDVLGGVQMVPFFLAGGRVPVSEFAASGRFFLEFEAGGELPGPRVIALLASIQNLRGERETIEGFLQIKVVPDSRPEVRVELANITTNRTPLVRWADTGAGYRVESATRLEAPARWQEANGVLLTEEGGLVFTPTLEPGEKSKFFRIVSLGLTVTNQEFALPYVAATSAVVGQTGVISGYALFSRLSNPSAQPSLKVVLPWSTSQVALAESPFRFEFIVPTNVVPGDYTYSTVLEGDGGKMATETRSLAIHRAAPTMDNLKLTQTAPGFPIPMSGYVSGGVPPYSIIAGNYFGYTVRGEFSLLVPTASQLTPGEQVLDLKIIDSAGTVVTQRALYTLFGTLPLTLLVEAPGNASPGGSVALSGELVGGVPPWRVEIEGLNQKTETSVSADLGAPYRFVVPLTIAPATAPGIYPVTERVTDAANSQVTKTVMVVVE